MKSFKLPEDSAKRILSVLTKCPEWPISDSSIYSRIFDLATLLYATYLNMHTSITPALIDRIRDSYGHQMVLDEQDIDILSEYIVSGSSLSLSKEDRDACAAALSEAKESIRGLDFIESYNGSSRGAILNPNSHPCTLEGCTGTRMYVKWQDGTVTYPCTKGCAKLSAHHWKIG